MIKNFVQLTLSVLAVTILLGTIACGNNKKVAYFSDSSSYVANPSQDPITTKYEPVIQPDDILAINVSSISSITTDKTASIDPTKLYNTGGTNFTLIAGNNQASSNGGYLVNSSGFINFPVLGDIKIAGLRVSEAKLMLEDKLKTHLINPVVEVRISNYKVTILGEVGHPGQVLAPNHNITILDAIAASGDITNYGRKDNIKLIREINGQREYATIDLTKKQILNSPYYYLKQNDILIVDALKIRKQETNSFLRYGLPITSAFIGVGLSIITFIINTK